MKVKQISILIIFLLFGAASSGFAKEINIKEVKISLFNKPVKGYRLFLDKSNKVVTNQVLKHVGKYDHKPFLFERTIIFENIFYPPVTERKEISLYYLLHDLPGGFSEMTVVAMYDYKRSVNTDEFPDLALKLLADIAKLVDRISGDVVRFEDLVLDDEMLEGLNERLREETLSNNTIEHFQEEEVENNSVRIKNDPFSDPEEVGGQSMARKLASRIAELDKREKRLLLMEEKFNLAQAEMEIEKKQVAKMSEQNNGLRDSISILNGRLGKLVMSELAGDGVSVSAEDHEAVTMLEDKLVEKQAGLIAVTSRNDSLTRVVEAMNNRIAFLDINNQQVTVELKEVRIANAELKSEYIKFKSDVYATSGVDGNPNKESFAKNSTVFIEAQNRAYADSLMWMRRQVARLEGDLSELAESYALLENEGPDTVFIKTKKASSDDQTSSDDEQEVNGESRDEIIALRSEINDLKDTNSEIKEDKKKVQAKLDASLSTLHNMESTSKKLLSKVEESQKKVAAQKAENETYIELSRVAGQRLESSRDSVRRFVKRNHRLEDKVDALEEEVKGDPVEIDSLNSRIKKQTKKNRKMNLVVTRLRYRVDSLANITKPANEQDAFLRNQRKVLADRNLELREQEKSFRNREKLLTQRESNFENRKSKIEEREQKLKLLKQYENQLKLLEQRLKSQGLSEIVEEMRLKNLGSEDEKPKARFSGISVEPILKEELEDGKKIQVFNLTLPLGYRSTEQKIAAYMLYHGFLYDEKYPDLEYNSLQMTRIHERPLEIKYRLKASGSETQVKVSFKIKGGLYIEPEENLQGYLEAKDFLRKLSRFNP